MSKHERRAARQSQLKLKVKEKDSAVQMARTDVVLAPKQQLPPQMARTGVLSPVGAHQRRSATPTACATSAEMALGLRQTSHSAGHWRFLPPFFFCGCWCKLFSTPPCWCPKSPFPSKTRNRQIARTSPLKGIVNCITNAHMLQSSMQQHCEVRLIS